MIDTSVNLKMEKPLSRCNECDEETRYYNIFISPTNERRTVCSVCLGRREKGFIAKPGFSRGSRYGVIPR